MNREAELEIKVLRLRDLDLVDAGLGDGENVIDLAYRQGWLPRKVIILCVENDIARRGWVIKYLEGGYQVSEKEVTNKPNGWGEQLYYSLNKDDQWLEGSPYDIGGRDTDVSQIAFSLEYRIKEMYPPNKIPENIILALEELRKVCVEAERQIDNFIGLVSEQRKTH